VAKECVLYKGIFAPLCKRCKVMFISFAQLKNSMIFSLPVRRKLNGLFVGTKHGSYLRCDCVFTGITRSSHATASLPFSPPASDRVCFFFRTGVMPLTTVQFLATRQWYFPPYMCASVDVSGACAWPFKEGQSTFNRN
jgi:hypothetical protein